MRNSGVFVRNSVVQCIDVDVERHVEILRVKTCSVRALINWINLPLCGGAVHFHFDWNGSADAQVARMHDNTVTDRSDQQFFIKIEIPPEYA